MAIHNPNSRCRHHPISHQHELPHQIHALATPKTQKQQLHRFQPIVPQPPQQKLEINGQTQLILPQLLQIKSCQHSENTTQLQHRLHDHLRSPLPPSRLPHQPLLPLPIQPILNFPKIPDLHPLPTTRNNKRLLHLPFWQNEHHNLDHTDPPFPIISLQHRFLRNNPVIIKNFDTQ